MTLPNERLHEVFDLLFQKAGIPPAMYRVYVSPSSIPDRYEVTVVWDGFDALSVTARQKWIWQRLRRLLPARLHARLGKVIARSAKEFIMAEDLAHPVSYLLE